MQARFHITERDYVRTGALHARLTWRGRVALVVAGLLLAAWVMCEPAYVWPILAGVAYVLVLILVVVPWIRRRHYRKYKLLHQEMTVTLLDEGVRFDLPNGCAMLTWDLILKWRYDADYVLIYPMPRIYHLVPATVAEQGFDMERLKAALTQHVGPAW